MATRIDLKRLQELLANGAQLIEVLPCAEYGKEHCPTRSAFPFFPVNHGDLDVTGSFSVRLGHRA